MSNLVRHPETGKPALEVVSYQEVEREQLQQEVTQRQAELDAIAQARTEHEARGNELAEQQAKAEAALEDCKRNIASYDEIAPQPEPDNGTEGAGGAGENANAEGAVSIPVVEQF